MTRPIPNALLLRATLALIETHPDRWNPAIIRELTPSGDMVGSFEAWAAELAGGTWAGKAALFGEPEDNPADVVGGVIDVDRRARRVLGLSHDEAMDLFHPSNNLRYVRQVVNELCEQAEREQMIAAAAEVDEESHRQNRLRAALHLAVDHIEPKGTNDAHTHDHR